MNKFFDLLLICSIKVAFYQLEESSSDINTITIQSISDILFETNSVPETLYGQICRVLGNDQKNEPSLNFTHNIPNIFELLNQKKPQNLFETVKILMLELAKKSKLPIGIYQKNEKNNQITQQLQNKVDKDSEQIFKISNQQTQFLNDFFDCENKLILELLTDIVTQQNLSILPLGDLYNVLATTLNKILLSQSENILVNEDLIMQIFNLSFCKMGIDAKNKRLLVDVACLQNIATIQLQNKETLLYKVTQILDDENDGLIKLYLNKYMHNKHLAFEMIKKNYKALNYAINRIKENQKKLQGTQSNNSINWNPAKQFKIFMILSVFDCTNQIEAFDKIFSKIETDSPENSLFAIKLSNRMYAYLERRDLVKQLKIKTDITNPFGLYFATTQEAQVEAFMQLLINKFEYKTRKIGDNVIDCYKKLISNTAEYLSGEWYTHPSPEHIMEAQIYFGVPLDEILKTQIELTYNIANNERFCIVSILRLSKLARSVTDLLSEDIRAKTLKKLYYQVLYAWFGSEFTSINQNGDIALYIDCLQKLSALYDLCWEMFDDNAKTVQNIVKKFDHSIDDTTASFIIFNSVLRIQTHTKQNMHDFMSKIFLLQERANKCAKYPDCIQIALDKTLDIDYILTKTSNMRADKLPPVVIQGNTTILTDNKKEEQQLLIIENEENKEKQMTHIVNNENDLIENTEQLAPIAENVENEDLHKENKIELIHTILEKTDIVEENLQEITINAAKSFVKRYRDLYYAKCCLRRTSELNGKLARNFNLKSGLIENISYDIAGKIMQEITSHFTKSRRIKFFSWTLIYLKGDNRTKEIIKSFDSENKINTDSTWQDIARIINQTTNKGQNNTQTKLVS